MNLDIQIAGKKTVRGWLNLKNSIEKDFNNEALWNKAFTFSKTDSLPVISTRHKRYRMIFVLNL